jgi:hypothetical protein
MKNLVLFLFLFTTTGPAFANRVDALKTDSDVASFIISLDKKFHKKDDLTFIVKSTEDIIKAFDCDSNIRAYRIKNWEKLDINNDGLTDLFVIGYWDNEYLSLVAIDMGNEKFKLVSLNYSPFPECQIAQVYKEGSLALLLFHSKKIEFNPNEKRLYMQKEVPATDTLIYKFDGFVERNKSPSAYEIQTVQFETGRCFGECPVYSIEFNKMDPVTYIAGMYSPKEGTFISYISAAKRKEIYDLLNYISVKKLNDDYKVDWTDDATCWLTVTFSDGSVKKIKDYGEIGTFGLRRLYALFSEMRDKEDWREQ